MTEKTFSTFVRAPVQRVWEFHRDVRALRLLSPPGSKVELLGEDHEVRDGALHVLRIRAFGLSLVWEARISDVRPPFGFVDTAERSPFAHWRHRHEFLEEDGGTRIVDRIEFRLPGGRLGSWFGRLIVAPGLGLFFRYRHAVTKRLLERQVDGAGARQGETPSTSGVGGA